MSMALDEWTDADKDAWRAGVHTGIEYLAHHGAPFTADDLHDMGIQPPWHPNAWGTVFMHASRRGLIQKVGHKPSTVPSRKGSILTVWQTT